MKIIPLDSWEKYCTEIAELQRQHAGRLILFRGQSNSCWKLRPTLERFSESHWTIREYSKLATSCAPQIESFTEKSFNFPTITETEKELDEVFHEYLIKIPSRLFELLVYLRHHEFPSPLLDWSSSPDIAAFFAFSKRVENETVAVFAYIEVPEGTKSVWAGEPQITAIMPPNDAHKRHHLQKCYYTVSTKPKDKDHEFACHEDVFIKEEPYQDILLKYVIPSLEHIKVLKFLDRKHINHFSLMESEEALLRTLAFRELEIKNL